MNTYTLTLPREYIEVILQGLGELPLKVSGPVFTAIQNQLVSQQKDNAPD